MTIWRKEFAGYAVASAGVAVGLTLLFLQLLASSPQGWDVYILGLVASSGGVLAYVLHQHLPIWASARRDTLIGGGVGLVSGVIYFTGSAIVVAVLVNSNIVLNKESIVLMAVGVIQLTVASASGGLVGGLVATLRKLRNE